MPISEGWFALGSKKIWRLVMRYCCAVVSPRRFARSISWRSPGVGSASGVKPGTGPHGLGDG
jgi:hypothetical protein